MDKWMEMSHLLDFYGGLLSERQRVVAQYTYNQDLSLSEISQLMGISRQAVSENLRRADTSLAGYEQALGLKERFTYLEREIGEIAASLEVLTDAREEMQPLINRLRALSSEEGEIV